MIRKPEEFVTTTVSNLRGGNGDVIKAEMFSQDETLGKTRLLATMTFPPGSSVGLHPHGPDAEIYYILSGRFKVTDNDVTTEMTAGQIMFTGGGGTHSAENIGTEDATMLAVVMN